MSREVIAADGRHYRISVTDPATIEVQDGPRRRWQRCITYPDGVAGTGAEVAREWLAVLGRVHEQQSQEAVST